MPGDAGIAVAAVALLLAIGTTLAIVARWLFVLLVKLAIVVLFIALVTRIGVSVVQPMRVLPTLAQYGVL